MIFKLNIGTLTNTVKGYDNTFEILVEQNNKVNSYIKELTDLGWSGNAKDEFLKAHKIKQEKYIKLERKIKFVRDIMQDIEKTKAVDLKTLCENFVNYIERVGQGGSLTGADAGAISFNGEPTLINRNIDNCINDDYNKISSNMNKIMDIVDSLEYTSFGIGQHISSEVETSIKNQTTSLTDFNNVFNTYYNRVSDLESSICSAFQRVSGVNEGSFKSSSVISPSGEIAEDKVLEIMSKNPKYLTIADKEILQYANTILGKDKYLKDYNAAVGKKLKDLLTRTDTRTLNEDDIYYLETVRGIIGADEYNKLARSMGGNIVPPENIHAACDAPPHAIVITQEDLDSFAFALEGHPYTAPIGGGLKEISVGEKYLTSVLSKVSEIGKAEKIVADVSKTISESGKISEIGYVNSLEISEGATQAENSLIRQISSDGIRNEIPLTAAQEAEIVEYAKTLGFPEEKIIFSRSGPYKDWNTGMMYDRFIVNTDVLPAKIPKNLGTLGANSRINLKGTISHEIVGHYEAGVAGRAFDLNTAETFSRNLALDEAQASIRAARFSQDLTSVERTTLLRDAIKRLNNAGIEVRDVKELLYIEKR